MDYKSALVILGAACGLVMCIPQGYNSTLKLQTLSLCPTGTQVCGPFCCDSVEQHCDTAMESCESCAFCRTFYPPDNLYDVVCRHSCPVVYNRTLEALKTTTIHAETTDESTLSMSVTIGTRSDDALAKKQFLFILIGITVFLIAISIVIIVVSYKNMRPTNETAENVREEFEFQERQNNDVCTRGPICQATSDRGEQNTLEARSGNMLLISLILCLCL